MFETFILMILVGALVGWVTSIIMNRNDQQGAVGNILVGIAGAFIGGILSKLLTGDRLTGATDLAFDPINIFWAIVGAGLLCAALNYKERGKIR